MSDTSPEIANIYRSMFDKLSPGERMHMAGEMFDVARRLARTGILLEQPDATEVEIQKRIFLRFYEHDVTPEQCEHVFGIIERRYANGSEGAA